jgi:hypothetical protein
MSQTRPALSHARCAVTCQGVYPGHTVYHVPLVKTGRSFPQRTESEKNPNPHQTPDQCLIRLKDGFRMLLCAHQDSHHYIRTRGAPPWQLFPCHHPISSPHRRTTTAATVEANQPCKTLLSYCSEAKEDLEYFDEFYASD